MEDAEKVEQAKLRVELWVLLTRRIEVNKETNDTLDQLLRAIRGRISEWKYQQLWLLIQRRKRVIAKMDQTLAELVALL